MLRRVLSAATVTALLLCGPRAHAIGALAGSVGETPAIASVRYAVTSAGGHTTRWASLDLERFPGAMAWIVPVSAEALVDEVTDAWFEALDEATKPRIVPPFCGARPSPTPVDVGGSNAHISTIHATDASIVDGLDDLHALIASFGFEISPEVDERLAVYVAASLRMLVLVYDGTGGRGRTRTVRITDDAPLAVPLLATLAGDAPIRVTTFVLDLARAQWTPGSEVSLDRSRLTLGSDGVSNYRALLQDALLAAGGTGSLVEGAGEDLVYRGTRSPTTRDTSPGLVGTYLERAIAYGDGSGPLDTCSNALVRAWSAGERVGHACPSGTLARGASAACVETSLGGEIPAATLRCGAADDLALAFSGLDPALTWITRLAGIVPARAFGEEPRIALSFLPQQGPFVVATKSDDTCLTLGDGVDGFGSTPGDRSVPIVPPPVSTEPPVSAEASAAVEVSGACAGSPSSSEGDSCGHSDGADSSDDAGCSSTSDSSDESGYDRAPDSSEDGCDGGSSSDSSKCSASRHRRGGRSHASAVTWMLAALLLPLRRHARRRRAPSGSART